MPLYLYTPPGGSQGLLLGTVGGVTGLAINEECCCGGAQPPFDCSWLPETLLLQLDYCGHTFYADLVRISQGVTSIWQTDCGFFTGPCPGPEWATNTMECFLFVCTGDNEFTLIPGIGCPGGNCNTSTNTAVQPEFVAIDPFEVVFHSGLANIVQGCIEDDPPCTEAPTVTIRIPTQ